MFIPLEELLQKEPELTLYRINTLCRGRRLKNKQQTLPPVWIRGVHWQYVDPSEPKCGRVFNLPLVQHYLKTRHDPKLHQREVIHYLESLEKGA